MNDILLPIFHEIFLRPVRMLKIITCQDFLYIYIYTYKVQHENIKITRLV